MKVIPAIDIMGGKVVRLTQGDVKQETVYFDSPLEVANGLAIPGVEMIHIVDLDGAMAGRPKNLKIIEKIAQNVKTKIELGGGIRDEDTIRKVIEAGIDRVVIGTRALENDFLKKISDEFKEKIVVGIDAREGMIYTKGWILKTNRRAIDFAQEVEKCGIRTINYTDISKDGMLKGPNIDSLKELLDATGLDVVAAGGVSSIDDLKELKTLERDGLKGVIIGKALYEGRIDLSEAVKVCSQKE
ncbi:MAG: 1-(5-phosphoribosyl)-5-[(5-phosphoribosylamino)methylideneamino]imidazole-4-carboxamide isomerase [Candidatus Omnitrophota bacterium]|jgi:phosphoribosylformimino-5-aminoimidazole carboxamide ribotide isomerase